MIHLLLFVLTIASTFFVGGFAYCFAIMTILLAHEMGHYFVSRYHKVPSSLPYFIPIPFPPFGTLGAVIKMKGVVGDKKALFDIGVAGPLAGFIVSIPFIIIGIHLSSVEPLKDGIPYIQLGDPLAFKILERVFFGEIPANSDIVLHPVGYAGWVGLFVTALNLLPAGQLDGGHIVFALFGTKSKIIFIITIIFMAFIAVFFHPGWILLVMLLVIFGMRHPEPLDVDTGLDTKRKIISIIILVVFILSFTPAPFPEIQLSATTGGVLP